VPRTTDSDATFLLPNPEVQPTVDLVTAAKAFGYGRSKAYELVEAGEFPVPVIRNGRSIRVPTAPVRRKLGLDGPIEEQAPALSHGQNRAGSNR
jgi:predicted DNA-binding transcriptional regulator AlpA